MKRITAVLLLLLCLLLKVQAQPAVDTTSLHTNNNPVTNTTTVTKPHINQWLDSNLFLNSRSTPDALPIQAKNRHTNEPFFYIISILLLVVGLMRTFYARYFSTLFRVFFNSSLRQNQLTDQLEQATFPSMVFNLLFVLVTGIYIYLCININTNEPNQQHWLLCLYCILAVGTCYVVKFLTLKLTGWLTGFKTEANTYIFLVFLINKIVGIFLLPIVMFIAFSEQKVVAVVLYISIIMLSLVVLLRFLRSYSLLQNKLKVPVFHFFLYVISIELVPIALIYKTVQLFFGINS